MNDASTPAEQPTGFDALPDRVVMITGATGGIGRALVARFVGRGWKVLATDLAAEAEFGTPPGAVRYVSADVRRHEQVAEAVRAAEELGSFVGCIANAGVTPEPFSDFAAAAREHWTTTLEINVLGTLNTFQAATAALLRLGRGGRLAATSSVAGIRSEPQLPAYSASKAGVNAIVRSLALELGDAGITVNAVAPGPVSGEHQDEVIEERLKRVAEGGKETRAERFERHRNEGRAVERLATAEDVAAAYAWLFSDETSYVTGQVLILDGGGVLV